jgi:glutathione S-transferase
MKLINATPSPYGRKVAIALKEKSISYDVQYDVPWIETTIVPQFSPLQQLPILITDEGENIYDSAYIIDWLELTHPSPSLLPADVHERLKVMLLRMLAERLAEIAQIVVFEAQRPEPSQPWLERQRRKIASGLAECAKMVKDRKPDAADAIHLAMGCTLGMFDVIIEQGLAEKIPEFKWRIQYPHLVIYAAALDGRPSFEQTRPVMFELDLKQVVD